MSKQVVIIGGGIIGLCSAYYLQKEGHQVSIVDQSNLDAGASYVNAGYLSPSHIVPLSAPGVMKKGLKWMFDSSSPLYIKPRLERDFLKWTWAFNKSCNANHVSKAIPAIKSITLLSQDLYDDIKQEEGFSFHYEKKGLLMLCQTEKMLDEEIKMADLARQEGLEARAIGLDELSRIEPNATMSVKGATYYQCDSHTTPSEFMEEMKAHLRAVGVQFYKNETVKDLEILDGEIVSIITDKQNLKADEFVLAAGSWSYLLSKKLGLKLLLQAGKGYRINTTRVTNISVPAILAEAKVAVTPMNGFTRFAGTMEIAGINHDINTARVEAIAKAATQYYPEIILSSEEKRKAASGLRPVSPDGLPYIGKSSKCKNITIATGHAMMGWSMATATGKLVQEIINSKKTSLPIDVFSPDRTF
ncbi:FAD-binding oxidoreductase [uncultured Psychroserpens sp.]|uniref:NAD(P)/FAD-dependent oxidoreductase n=1 Tax=uncultured Psychroserpens sp. TaxID=255436 RepID=UPI00262B357D|nr:FAD-dependent oxidoreductase [uncultured Psychroserpens sp.]